MPFPMAPPLSTKKEVNRGAWTTQEDEKLAQIIEIHGPRRWKSIASKAGLNRCGKSCRLRWMNYLRPNIKRGNISDQEEDLILRLHKLLGNRWSLIAGRLPGRTDNEIKNYWNSHLSKKLKQNDKHKRICFKTKALFQNEKTESSSKTGKKQQEEENGSSNRNESCSVFQKDGFFDFYGEEPLNLEWMSKFLENDESWFNF